MRLVQSGQHAAAIKLDHQFASIARRGDKAQKAAHDRHDVSAASISHGGGPRPSVNELYFPASVFFGKVRALPQANRKKSNIHHLAFFIQSLFSSAVIILLYDGAAGLGGGA